MSSLNTSMPISCMTNTMQPLLIVHCKPLTLQRASPYSLVIWQLTFGSCNKLGKISSQATAIRTTASTISKVLQEPKLVKNFQQRQNQIDQHASKISSLEVHNWKLTQLLQPRFLVDTITQEVASSLNISGGNKPQKSNINDASGYTGKSYLGKPRPLQLVPGVDGSLDSELSCQYCKDTGHLEENCIKLNRRLAQENREPDQLPKILEN